MAQKVSNIDKIRHSLAHILAMVVLEVYPNAKLGIGPTIENGFYYDFDLPGPLGEDDFKALEKSMQNIIGQNIAFSGQKLTPIKARKMFKHQPYKLDLIKQYIKDKKQLSAYTSGSFTDLCKGGHVKNSKEINTKTFKLIKIAGAYWKGDEKNKMLTRIYAVAFESKKELDNHLRLLEEAKKRDHRILGKKLDLFTSSDLVGPGLPLWTPKGTLIRHLLDEFVWQLRSERGYERVEIPHITKKELYEVSGHWDKFKDELFKSESREKHYFAMKPMNCPHHTQIYKRKVWSYKELPQRYANTTMCYRDEQTGELHGLSRVRSFTQDDAHVFCRESQAKEEAFKIWDIVEKFYRAFDFDLVIRLSTHNPKDMSRFLGDIKTWNKAVKTFKLWLKERGTEYELGIGEAAFYGPKIDFIAKDSLGRKWQVATIQVDKNLPERFDLSCINEKGEEERIIMLHAAIMGSIERFVSILIEHVAGAFPVWLSPTQVLVIPVGATFRKYALKVAQRLKKEGLRVELSNDQETVGKSIRQGEIQKIPYMLVVGEKEEKSKSISIRKRGNKNQETSSINEFIESIIKEISKKV